MEVLCSAGWYPLNSETRNIELYIPFCHGSLVQGTGYCGNGIFVVEHRTVHLPKALPGDVSSAAREQSALSKSK
jgi:hypothetical protein